VFFLLGFTLPVLALASLTSHFAEAVVGGLGVFLGIAGFIGFSDTFREAGLFDPTFNTGVFLGASVREVCAPPDWHQCRGSRRDPYF
jgi:hypothetical protein